MLHIFIPKHQDYNSIDVNSLEVPRLTWKQKRACWKYRTKIERSREYGKRVIDNIDAGMLVAWLNPIQLGINLLNPGGEVFVPAGTYTQTDTTITGVSNLLLRGSGYASQLKAAKSSHGTSDSDPIFKIDTKNYVEISNIYFNGDGATIHAAAKGVEHDHSIHLTDSNNVFIHNCFFLDPCGDGIYCADTDDVIISDCNIKVTNQQASPTVGRNGIAIVEGARIAISNCKLEAGYPAAIDIEPNANLTVENVAISNCIVFDSESHGIQINADASGAVANHIHISNCIVDTTAAGTYYGVRFFSCQHCGISDSKVYDAGNLGVYIQSSNDITVSGCDVYNNGVTGIYSGSDCNRLHIIGNKSYANGAHGISLAGSSSNENDNCTISNNACYNNAASSDGINVSYCDGLVLTGNQCFDDQGGSQTQRYGIRATNCDRIIIIGNNCYDNVTGNLSYSSNTGEEYAHNLTV